MYYWWFWIFVSHMSCLWHPFLTGCEGEYDEWILWSWWLKLEISSIDQCDDEYCREIVYKLMKNLNVALPKGTQGCGEGGHEDSWTNLIWLEDVSSRRRTRMNKILIFTQGDHLDNSVGDQCIASCWGVHMENMDPLEMEESRNPR
jgi:hypothetical protein